MSRRLGNDPGHASSPVYSQEPSERRLSLPGGRGQGDPNLERDSPEGSGEGPREKACGTEWKQRHPVSRRDPGFSLGDRQSTPLPGRAHF